MADLGSLTKTVAKKIGSTTMNVGKAAGGVAGSIAATTMTNVIGGLRRATDIDALRPRNVAASTLDAAGLGALMPALMGSPQDKEQVSAAQRVADQNKAMASSFKPMEDLLQKLLTVNEKMLENTNALVDFAKKQISALEKSNELVEKQTLQDIENLRESRKAPSSVAAPANDNKVGAEKKSGGFLSGIMDSVKGLLGFLAPIGEFIASIGSVLGGLARFAYRFLGPIGVLAGIFLALERQDWATLFDNLGKVFGDLAEGKIFDAIVRMIGTIGDVLIKGVLRIVSGILKFFGFEDLAQRLSNFLDNINFAEVFVDLVKKLVDVIMNIGTYISDAAKKVGPLIMGIYDFIVDGAKSIYNFFASIPEYIGKAIDAVGDFFKSIGTAISNAIDAIWNFFKGIGEAVSNAISAVGDFFKSIGESISGAASTVMNFFVSIKDWTVEKFTNATKAFSDWWDSFSVIDPILDTFKSVKGWMVEKFDNATKAFGEWWDGFSVIDIVMTPFNYLKDTAISTFDNLYNAVSELFSFDLVGKISETIGNVISGVWNFFKELPSKAVDLISGFLPDSLKNFFKSMFGGGSQTAQAETATRTQTAAIPTDRNVVPAIQATTQTASLVPPPELNVPQTGREQVFNQASARMSVEQAQPPIIINNSTNVNGGGGANQNNPPRTSGAVHTAPQSSHIDRALYGDYYGSGVA